MALNNKKIFKNSIIVYIRLIITMFINLYTSRIVLEQLGVTDFGTYNIVAGISALFSSIKTLFSSAIQRYYNYEIGFSNDHRKINTIFCLGFYIHLIFAIILTISLEIVGIWLLNNKLDIPLENINIAKWLFQMSVIGTTLSMLAVPYNAMIIAREKMGFFAVLSIVDVIFKFCVALSLTFINEKLLWYGIGILMVGVINFIVEIVYCKNKFIECKLRRVWDKKLFKDLSKFAGWNFIGNISFSLTNEVSNVFLNIFGGVAANAARGIAYQVKSAVTSFMSNTLVAVRPQATQEYAKGNMGLFFNLIYFSSKITYYISICLTIPIIFYIEPILNLWLGQIPENSSIFIRIILIQIIIRSFHEPIDLIFKSSGNIKYYQLTSVIITIIGLISIYFVMKNNAPIYAVFVGLCIMELIEYILILLLSQKEGLNIFSYLKKVTVPTSVVTIIIILLSYATHLYIPSNLFIIGLIIIGIICIISILLVGLTAKERKSIYSLIRKK